MSYTVYDVYWALNFTALGLIGWEVSQKGMFLIIAIVSIIFAFAFLVSFILPEKKKK